MVTPTKKTPAMKRAAPSSPADDIDNDTTASVTKRPRTASSTRGASGETRRRGRGRARGWERGRGPSASGERNASDIASVAASSPATRPARAASTTAALTASASVAPADSTPTAVPPIPTPASAPTLSAQAAAPDHYAPTFFTSVTGVNPNMRCRPLHDCTIFFTDNFFPNQVAWDKGDAPGEQHQGLIGNTKNRKFTPCMSWRLAKAPSTIMASAWNLPTSNVWLEDVWVYFTILTVDPRARGRNWPNYFDGRGRVRRNRVPCGPPVLYQIARVPGHLVAEFNGYVLGGDCVAATTHWHINEEKDYSNSTNFRTISFGNVLWNPLWPVQSGAVIRQVSLTQTAPGLFQQEFIRTEVWEAQDKKKEDKRGHERFIRDNGFEVVNYATLGLGDVVYCVIPEVPLVSTVMGPPSQTQKKMNHKQLHADRFQFVREEAHARMSARKLRTVRAMAKQKLKELKTHGLWTKLHSFIEELECEEEMKKLLRLTVREALKEEFRNKFPLEPVLGPEDDKIIDTDSEDDEQVEDDSEKDGESSEQDADAEIGAYEDDQDGESDDQGKEDNMEANDNEMDVEEGSEAEEDDE